MRQKKSRVVLDEIRETLRKHYPFLHLKEEDKRQFVRGVFPVVEEGMVIDRFLIEIEILPKYPHEVPLVREIGNRIPHEADRHVYNNGYSCLFLREARWECWPLGSDFLRFLQVPVNDYFYSQHYFEKTGKWVFGERRHNYLGVFDYYSEELGTKDFEIIRNLVIYLTKGHVKGHWPCYCGSGLKMRNCHFEKMLEMHNKIPPSVAKCSLQDLNNLIRDVIEFQSNIKLPRLRF